MKKKGPLGTMKTRCGALGESDSVFTEKGQRQPWQVLESKTIRIRFTKGKHKMLRTWRREVDVFAQGGKAKQLKRICRLGTVWIQNPLEGNLRGQAGSQVPGRPCRCTSRRWGPPGPLSAKPPLINKYSQTVFGKVGRHDSKLPRPIFTVHLCDF